MLLFSSDLGMKNPLFSELRKLEELLRLILFFQKKAEIHPLFLSE